MNSPAFPPDRCPLCGRDNACAAARGEENCWCFTVEISKGALERVPAAAQGVACLCRDCAAGEVPSPCNDLCELDAVTGGCRSCLRTMDEILAWPTADDDAKRDVLALIAERRRSL